jgi:ribosomal protein S25
MSGGAKKKWTKNKTKDKRDYASVLLAEVAAEIEKNVPRSKLITPSKLADRYKISLTVARKVLMELQKEGRLVALIDDHSLKAYGRTSEAAGLPEVEETKTEEAKGGKRTGKKK